MVGRGVQYAQRSSFQHARTLSVMVRVMFIKQCEPTVNLIVCKGGMHEKVPETETHASDL